MDSSLNISRIDFSFSNACPHESVCVIKVNGSALFERRVPTHQPEAKVFYRQMHCDV